MQTAANPAGATLLELLIAVTVSAIVVTLAGIVFVDIYKGFMLQKRRVEMVQETITAKKRIERFLAGIETVTECSEHKLQCVRGGADTITTIQFTADSLCVDGKAVCRKLADVSFALVKKNNGNRWTLLWNARLTKGGWFGSALAERL